jgi:hypothetical protein
VCTTRSTHLVLEVYNKLTTFFPCLVLEIIWAGGVELGTLYNFTDDVLRIICHYHHPYSYFIIICCHILLSCYTYKVRRTLLNDIGSVKKYEVTEVQCRHSRILLLGMFGNLASKFLVPQASLTIMTECFTFWVSDESPSSTIPLKARNIITSWSWALLQKLPVVQLLKNSPQILCNPKVHFRVHKTVHWSIS